MNDISISVVYPKMESDSMEEIMYWKQEFEGKIVIENVSYDKNWTETKSRIEFKGKHGGTQ